MVKKLDDVIHKVHEGDFGPGVDAADALADALGKFDHLNKLTKASANPTKKTRS